MKNWVVNTEERCKLCGKVAYQDKEDADYQAKALSSQHHSYQCPYGNGWHLSSKS